MFFRNILSILMGQKTWVGYSPLIQKNNNPLPRIRKGVLFSTDILQLNTYNDEIIRQVNTIYAQDYKISTDLQIIIKAFKHLGR